MSDLGKRALVVLQEGDQLKAGWSCPGTAECCHFGVTGRQPHPTEAEWQVIADELERQGRPVPAPREDRVCPFLSEGRCSIYAARPLGCRTFYCHRGSGPHVDRRAREDLFRRLEVMSSDPHARGRPLTTWLNQARRRR